MNLLRNSGGLLKARVVGTILLLVLSQLVSGCGGGGGSFVPASPPATDAGKSIAEINTSIIQLAPFNTSSLAGAYPQQMGRVAGTQVAKSVFFTMSSSSNLINNMYVHRYSVDTSGRLIKQKTVFGTLSSVSTFVYDGDTTNVKAMSTPSFSSPVGIQQSVFTYDSSGRITGYTITLPSGTPPTVLTKTAIIVYSGSGRTEIITDDATTPPNTHTDVYDKHNYRLSSTSGGIVYLRGVPTFDASGNLSADKVYVRPYFAEEILFSDNIYTYGPSGLLSTISNNYDIYSSPPTGNLMDTVTSINTYGSNEKISRTVITTTDPAGNPTSVQTTAYSYDTNGHLSSYITEMPPSSFLRVIMDLYITLVSGKDEQ